MENNVQMKDNQIEQFLDVDNSENDSSDSEIEVVFKKAGDKKYSSKKLQKKEFFPNVSSNNSKKVKDVAARIENVTSDLEISKLNSKGKEETPSRKRKAQNTESEGKPPNMLCSNVPFVKLKRYAGGTLWKVSESPKSKDAVSHRVNSSYDMIGSNSSKTPRKLTAKKNLFSPEKTPNKEQKRISPTKNKFNVTTTPKKERSNSCNSDEDKYSILDDSNENLLVKIEHATRKQSALQLTPQKSKRSTLKQTAQDDDLDNVVLADRQTRDRTPLKEIETSPTTQKISNHLKSLKPNTSKIVTTDSSKSSMTSKEWDSRRLQKESSLNSGTPTKKASSKNLETEHSCCKRIPSKDPGSESFPRGQNTLTSPVKTPSLKIKRLVLNGDNLITNSPSKFVENSPSKVGNSSKSAYGKSSCEQIDYKISSTKKRQNKIALEDGTSDLHSPSNKKIASPLKMKITVTTPISKKKEGRGFLTPSMAKRTHETDNTVKDILDKTRKQLHISTVPKSLPCRDAEFDQIKSFLMRKIEHSAGGCMYISGVPGTGKTATVHAVIRDLQKDVNEGDLPEFDFVEVNGLRLTEPRQAYVRIYQALTNQKVTPDQAQQLLNKRFSGSCKNSTIILVDELDYLCNRRQDVVYNILDWPSKRSSGLVVLTISNTMDLPERTLKGRVTSRMGLTRLTFQPYTHHQLKEIVQDRLSGTTTFHPDAIQLVARKVAAVSGDARRALDICRRTTELIHGCKEQITVTHVEEALVQLCAGARVQVIRSLSGLGQLVLRSVRDVCQRTGVDETTAGCVYKHLRQLVVLEGGQVPTTGALLHTCVSLVGVGLLVAEKGRVDLARKMSLNVSSDDIHYALDNV